LVLFFYLDSADFILYSIMFVAIVVVPCLLSLSFFNFQQC